MTLQAIVVRVMGCLFIRCVEVTTEAYDVVGSDGTIKKDIPSRLTPQVSYLHQIRVAASVARKKRHITVLGARASQAKVKGHRGGKGPTHAPPERKP